MNAKYITFKDLATGTDSICIFSSFVEHNRMANNTMVFREILGAGFIRFDNGKPVCYGDSFSLKVKARPEEDTWIACQALGVKK